MKHERTPWSHEEIEDFRQWHIALLIAREYGEKVTVELTIAREKFLSSIKVKDA